MTTQGTLVEITQRSQETATTAFTDWTGSMQDYSTDLIKAVPGLPGARELVDNYFNFAEALLRTGREFVTTLVDAGAEGLETTRAATEKATHDAAKATQQASESARAATKKATHDAPKPSRNGAGK